MMLNAKEPMRYDTWLYEYEDNLLDLWTYLQNLGAANIYIFDRHRITFPAFCELAYAHSTLPEECTSAAYDDTEPAEPDDAVSSSVPPPSSATRAS